MEDQYATISIDVHLFLGSAYTSLHFGLFTVFFFLRKDCRIGHVRILAYISM